jgi:hypothetical protein
MDYNWGGFSQMLSGTIRMKDMYSGNLYYEGPFDQLQLSDDTMTLYVIYQGNLMQEAYQGSWWWGDAGITITLDNTQDVSAKFKQWWDKHAVSDLIEFYYQSSPYTVALGTTWE